MPVSVSALTIESSILGMVAFPAPASRGRSRVTRPAGTRRTPRSSGSRRQGRVGVGSRRDQSRGLAVRSARAATARTSLEYGSTATDGRSARVERLGGCRRRLPRRRRMGRTVGVSAVPRARGGALPRPPRVRRRPRLAHATLYATALGLYRARVNGTVVDDQEFKPGWTSTSGGWCTSRRTSRPADHGSQRALRVGRRRLVHRTLRVLRPSKRRSTGTSRRSRRCSCSSTTTDPTRHFAPETTGGLVATARSCPAVSTPARRYDARRRDPAWMLPGFDDNSWSAPAVAPLAVTPSSRWSPPVRRIEEVAVKDVITTPSGRTLLDFGQNLVGRLRMTRDLPRGTEIVLRHAEVLEDGELGTRPLRLAAATDHYVAAGRAGHLGTRLHLPRVPLRGGRGLARLGRSRPHSSRW